MAGDYFGPERRYQVVGKPVTMLDRISPVWPGKKESCILMSQYTRDILHARETLEEIAVVPREGLEDLHVSVAWPVHHSWLAQWWSKLGW